MTTTPAKSRQQNVTQFIKTMLLLSALLLSLSGQSFAAPASQAQTDSNKNQSSASISQAQSDSDKKQLSTSNAESEDVQVEKKRPINQVTVDDLLGDLSAVSPSK